MDSGLQCVNRPGITDDSYLESLFQVDKSLEYKPMKIDESFNSAFRISDNGLLVELTQTSENIAEYFSTRTDVAISKETLFFYFEAKVEFLPPRIDG